jgi:hypothetical protein
MTMHDEWTDRLSEYLDDELTADERRGIEWHLAGCAACTTTLEDLTRVVKRAQSLPARPPQTDLWNGIADRIGAAGAPGHSGRSVGDDARGVTFRVRAARRVSFTLPQLAAASILLAMVSGGVAWRLRAPAAERTEILRDDSTRNSAEPQFRQEPSPAPAPIEQVSFADAQYDSAVADLQRALQQGRGHLDPATIAIVEQNLKIIDRALEQAKQAVMDDPGNSYLTSHLVETRRKKLELLRRAAALASEAN